MIPDAVKHLARECHETVRDLTGVDRATTMRKFRTQARDEFSESGYNGFELLVATMSESYASGFMDGTKEANTPKASATPMQTFIMGDNARVANASGGFATLLETQEATVPTPSVPAAAKDWWPAIAVSTGLGSGLLAAACVAWPSTPLHVGVGVGLPIGLWLLVKNPEWKYKVWIGSLIASFIAFNGLCGFEVLVNGKSLLELKLIGMNLWSFNIGVCVLAALILWYQAKGE